LIAFWGNRVEESGIPASLTRIPELPDQKEFLDTWFEFHQGWFIGDPNRGQLSRIPIAAEPWREVDPGHLPRTEEEISWGQLRSGIEDDINEIQRQRAMQTRNEQQADQPETSLDEFLDDLIAQEAEEQEEGDESGAQQPSDMGGSFENRNAQTPARRHLIEARQEAHRARSFSISVPSRSDHGRTVPVATDEIQESGPGTTIQPQGSQPLPDQSLQLEQPQQDGPQPEQHQLERQQHPHTLRFPRRWSLSSSPERSTDSIFPRHLYPLPPEALRERSLSPRPRRSRSTLSADSLNSRTDQNIAPAMPEPLSGPPNQGETEVEAEVPTEFEGPVPVPVPVEPDFQYAFGAQVEAQVEAQAETTSDEGTPTPTESTTVPEPGNPTSSEYDNNAASARAARVSSGHLNGEAERVLAILRAHAQNVSEQIAQRSQWIAESESQSQQIALREQRITTAIASMPRITRPGTFSENQSASSPTSAATAGASLGMATTPLTASGSTMAHRRRAARNPFAADGMLAPHIAARNPVGLDADDSRPNALGDDQLKVKMACVVCMTQLVSTVCLPCGHLCMCSWCADQWLPGQVTDRSRPRLGTDKCPVCRGTVLQKVSLQLNCYPLRYLDADMN
jgi:hypothetical protein